MRQPLSRTKQPKINPASINNILLIRLRRIGDVVMTTPALSALRQRFPHAHITYIIEAPYKELVEDHPALDKVIILPRHLSPSAFLSCVTSIRKKKYDILIDFHGGPRAFLLTFFSRARIKIGYKLKYKHFFYDIALPRKPEKGYFHSVENHMNLVNALDKSSLPPPSLQLPEPREEEKARITSFLQKNSLHNTRIIVFHIGAGNKFREWGIPHQRELIQLLSRIPETAIIMVGAVEDKEIEASLLETNSDSLYSLIGKLNLRELQALIAQAALFVGPDSGPMHIAAATNIPIVALFGPTLPAHFAPWKANAIILEKDLDCRPCRQIECISQDYRCLQSITAEEVYQACRQALSIL